MILKNELITINLESALKGDKKQNLILQVKDKLTIFSYENMVPAYSVQLSGHVKNPGTYSLIDSMTVYDLIFSTVVSLTMNSKKERF